MRISVKVEELIPVIMKYIKDKYGLNDEVVLEYTSKTTFLTFDSKED